MWNGRQASQAHRSRKNSGRPGQDARTSHRYYHSLPPMFRLFRRRLRLWLRMLWALARSERESNGQRRRRLVVVLLLSLIGRHSICRAWRRLVDFCEAHLARCDVWGHEKTRVSFCKRCPGQAIRRTWRTRATCTDCTEVRRAPESTSGIHSSGSFPAG